MPTLGKVPDDPSPSAERPRREMATFREDESGQLLILTGVLLVMGFVVVGSTLVQVQTLEESTARLARESILVPFDDLVLKFNQTLRDSVTIGETNVTVFHNTANHSADRLRESAIGRGLYLSAETVKDPSTAIFWRDARCGAFKEVDDGFIIAYHAETREESIVGAVYEIYATNGDQTMKTQYYVKFYDCLPRTTTTFVDSYKATPNTKGPPETVVDFVKAKSEMDGGAAANVTEQTVTGTAATTWITADEKSVSANWEDKNSIKFSDDESATKLSTEGANDYFRFNLDVPADAGVFTELVLHVDGWHANGQYTDDHIDIWATLDGKTSGPYEVTTGTSNPSTPPTVSIPLNPNGVPVWTRAELDRTVWNLTIDEGPLGQDSGVDWFVDSVRAEAKHAPVWEAVTVDMMFDFIPPIFQSNEVEMKYQVTQHVEDLTFEVWDGTQWNTRATITNPPLKSWQKLTYVLTDAEMELLPDNKPKFRLSDTSSTDPAAPTSIEIDYLKITSEFTAP